MATSTSMLLGIRPLPVIFYTKLLLACAYALDPQCNRQLMEYPWYSFWNIVLVDLTAGLPGYIVFPQFPVWIIPPDEDEDVDGESDIESDDAHEPDVDEEPYDPTPTTSPFPTSQPPLPSSPSPGKANKFKLTDFAVLGLSGDTTQVEGQPSLFEALTRLRSRAIIDKILIPLIVEIKRDRVNFFSTVLLAQDDAIEQSNFIFASTHQRYVVAIAAAGVYWSWAVIRRPPHLPVTTAEERDDPTFVPPSHDVSSDIWSNIYNFGSADSDAAFHDVFSRMVGLRKGRRVNNPSQSDSRSSEDEDIHDSGDGGDPASPSNSSQYSSDGSSSYNYSDGTSNTDSSEDSSSDTSGEVDYESRDHHDGYEDDTETEDGTDTRSDAGDDTETEDDRSRFTTPSQYTRQSHAPGPHTPPSESPDPLVDYSEVGPTRPPLRLQVGTPAPMTPPHKGTVKRNRATDSPREAVATAMPPADQVSPSSKPLRKRGKMHAMTAPEPM